MKGLGWIGSYTYTRNDEVKLYVSSKGPSSGSWLPNKEPLLEAANFSFAGIKPG